MKTTGLRLLKVAAIVFAIGASAWIVILAHEGANPTDPDPKPSRPASEGTEPGKRPPEVVDPAFLHSSKGAAGLPTELGDEEEEPVFLPSSKSAIGIAPKAKDAPAEEAKKKKKPVFLPSSKSIPFREPVHKPGEPDK